MTSVSLRTGRRFVGIRPEALDVVCRERGIGGHERRLLVDLVLDASWQSHAVEGFTLTDYATRLGFGPSHRRTLKAQLARLEAAGVIDRGVGRIEILVYGELVHGADRAAPRAIPTRPARGDARPTRDIAPLDVEDLEDPPEVLGVVHGDSEDVGGDDLAQAEEVLAVVGERLEPAQRRDLTRRDPQRAQLVTGIARLLDHLAAAEIVDAVLRPRLPADTVSVAGLLWYRVRRLLTEAERGEPPAGPAPSDARRQSAWAHGEAMGRTPDSHLARGALECAYAADAELLDLALQAESETRSRLQAVAS